MPRTDGTDDKRWYNLHVRWIYQSMTDTLCPRQIIKCDWLGLEWTKLKSISEMCFFSKGIAESSDQVPDTKSFHSLQNFKVVLLSQGATCSTWKQQVMTVDVNSEDAVAEHPLVMITMPLTTGSDLWWTLPWQGHLTSFWLSSWNLFASRVGIKLGSFQNMMGKP